MRRNLSNILYFLTLIILILVLSFLNTKGYLGFPKNIIQTTALPLQKVLEWSSNKASNFFETITSFGHLKKENLELKEEVQELQAIKIRLQELEIENKELREQLGLELASQNKLIFAYVVGQDPQDLSQVILIDKGEKDGLRENQTVIKAGGILVGRVIEVGGKTSKVLLITDSSCQCSALIQETRASGLIKGQHGIGLIMEMIPIEKEIEPGQTAITSGQDNIFTKGLIIGKVTDVSSQETEIFKTAKIDPMCDFDELEMVFVIVGKGS